ncbi:MAG: C45 family peptidase [Nanoarchaeota archaeon]|nr:C45 family peptidase [Nanoarchaeota archaeon]
MKKIKHFVIEGKDNYDFGFNLGKKLSKDFKKRISLNKKIYKSYGMDYQKMTDESKKFIPVIKKNCPKFLKEIEGMSEGSGVSFDDLFVMNCEEELLDFYVPKCSSLAVKTKNGEIFLGHNEDWIKDYRNGGLVVVSGKIGGLKFLSLTYIGNLVGASCSLNNYGLAFTGNSLNFERFRFGIPRSFILRSLIETRTLKEAENLLESHKQSIASNILLVFKNSSMEDIEKLWMNCDLFFGNKWIVHTNNPLVKKEQNKGNTEDESVLRYKRAYEILSKEKDVTIESLKKVLRDHKNAPYGICGHDSKIERPFGVTIASVIIDSKKQWMEVCPGNPCRNKYFKYYLK